MYSNNRDTIDYERYACFRNRDGSYCNFEQEYIDDFEDIKDSLCSKYIRNKEERYFSFLQKYANYIPNNDQKELDDLYDTYIMQTREDNE